MNCRIFRGILLIAPLALVAACASRTTRVSAPAAAVGPALRASKQDLVSRYQRQAGTLRSLNATVHLKAVTGSAFTGVVKQYRQIDAYILAQRPASIRVVGQAPVVGTDIFDMVSDGTTFRMYIPSKKQFLVGPARLERTGKNALENLRPQHLVDALFWPEIAADQSVTIEEETIEQPPSRNYVLTILQRTDGEFAIDRRVWFDRSNLSVSRIEIFGSQGRLQSDIRYADWSVGEGGAAFPRRIVLWRPQEGYRLEIDATRIALNQPIPPGRFQLAQPPGTQRVQVGQSESDL